MPDNIIGHYDPDTNEWVEVKPQRPLSLNVALQARESFTRTNKHDDKCEYDGDVFLACQCERRRQIRQQSQSYGYGGTAH